MKRVLYIDNDMVGEVDFKIIDETMGAIGGVLSPNDSYKIMLKTLLRLGFFIF